MEAQICIEVRKPLIDRSQTFEFHTYEIFGIDSIGQFCKRRRYRHFTILRQILLERWPGLYIPPIPQKKTQGNMDEKYVIKRSILLNNFCIKIAQRKYLIESKEFQLFIRGGDDYYKLKTLQQFSYPNTLSNYEKWFGSLVKNNPQENKVKVIEVMKYLIGAQKKINKLIHQFDDAFYAKQKYNEQFRNCSTKVLPSYQDKFYAKHVEMNRKKLKFSGNQKFSSIVSQYNKVAQKNPFEIYVEMVKQEHRQIQAFIEAIKKIQVCDIQRENIRKKRKQSKKEYFELKEGKTTLKFIFTFGNRQKQMNQLLLQYPKWKTEQKSLQECIKIMQEVILIEFNKYVSQREKNFVISVLEANKIQVQQIKVYKEYLNISSTTNQE